MGDNLDVGLFDYPFIYVVFLPLLLSYMLNRLALGPDYRKLWEEYKMWRFGSIPAGSLLESDLSESDFHEFYRERIVSKNREMEFPGLFSRKASRKRNWRSRHRGYQLDPSVDHLRRFEAQREADYRSRVIEQT
jgi:hypothetical protein